jgi:hypothetical protein
MGRATTMKPYDYDIVLLSDLRYPGGNSTSLSEEIKAQARAGYSTGLVHLRAPHMARPRSFNRKVISCLSSGLAELIPARRQVRARVLVIRQPRLFTEDLVEPLRVQADTTVMVVEPSAGQSAAWARRPLLRRGGRPRPPHGAAR